MTRRVMMILAALPAIAMADTNAVDPAAVVTNTWIVSNTTNAPAWTRQAVMVRPDNTIIDPSGVFVSGAEAAAASNTVDRVQEVSEAAIAGMAQAVGSLTAVTNQIPDTAYQVTVTIPPPTAPASLMGFVVKESTDGERDTQWVWYSHALARKPIRRVVYITPSGTVSQPAEWVDWAAEGETVTAHGRTWTGCHKCTILRPVAARGISAVTRLNEQFGGDNGFDFGTIIVTVAGRPTVTTNITGRTTGMTISINNGFIKSTAKEASDE